MNKPTFQCCILSFALCVLSFHAQAADDLSVPAAVDATAPAALNAKAAAAAPATPPSTADAAALAAAVASATPPSPDSTVPKEDQVMQQITMLNQIPETQLSDDADPGLSIVKALHEIDGPEFLTLRKLVGQAKVRGPLTPSARGVIASIISQRWDAFNLAGNLWLGALKSGDPTMRAKARQKIVSFIQAPHIPVLIEMLTVPGVNAQAYEVLQEVTGQTLPPDVKSWRAWWAQVHAQIDVVAILLKDTQDQVTQHPITPLDADRFWYAPDGLDALPAESAHRSPKDDQKFQDWSTWVGQDVKKTVDQWSSVKPALDRLTHQQDPRVTQFLEGLVSDPGYGNYASVVLAWRGNPTSLSVIQKAYDKTPTVGRALGRGSLGDKSALKDLLKMIAHHPQPLTFALMDDAAHADVQVLHTVGEIPAEKAFELLSHHSFDFIAATDKAQKKKSLKDAEHWLKENQSQLTLDHNRGYYTAAAN